MSTNTVKFSAVGDLTFGDHPLCVGFGAHSRFKHEEPLFPFRRSLSALQRADLLFGNLECTHSSLGLNCRNYDSVQMRGDPRLLEALTKAGFRVVNVANNHSLQHGNDTFCDTVAMLERVGVMCCGIAADAIAKRSKPLIVRQNGVSIGFLGYSLRPRQYFDHLPLYAEGEPEEMLRDVQELRRSTDVVVVSVHWGEEFIQAPAPHEVQLAHRLVDAGAALIIGHHPHVLRGIERYGSGCIVYSLGNFVCDMVWDDTLRTSLIFQCELSPDGLRSIELIPVFINEDFQPEVLSGPAAERVLRDVAELSGQLAGAASIADADAESLYARQADEAHRRIRSKSHRFFLSRFWKYPAVMLVQQLATYVRNRVHERVVRA